MTTKVNVLIDGGFFWQCFKKNNNRNSRFTDVVKTVEDVMTRVRNKTNGGNQDILFCVCYSDCRPFRDII